jgi:hypothetical protein
MDDGARRTAASVAAEAAAGTSDATPGQLERLAAFRESAVYGNEALKIVRRIAHPRT